MNWWGLSLARQARTKSGAEADNLLTEACEKYERAVQIGPNRPEILGNFGSALLELSKTRSGHDAEMILGRAREKLMLAEGIRPGTGAYDLACTEALLGDPDSCRRWLTVACDAGTLPSREHLLDDPDLTSVRELAWFADFVR